MAFKTTLMAGGAAIWALAAPATAQAQASFSFNLPSQPLERSLRAVAAQTGSNIVFSDAAVRGKAAPPLKGEFSAAAAYRNLLQGSGLTLTVTSGGSFVVGASGAAADAPGASSRARGAIYGHIEQADGNRNVAGALVRIVETGQTTEADDLGAFRFPDVPPGVYTLEISFLGFETIREQVVVEPGTPASLEFVMAEPGGAGSQILVYGSRSARANALNLQRTARNN